MYLKVWRWEIKLNLLVSLIYENINFNILEVFITVFFYMKVDIYVLYDLEK